MLTLALIVILACSLYFSSSDAQKVGCFSYDETGQTVAGGNGYGSALNQFFTDRFYVDDLENIYLLDRSASVCEYRFLLWPKNSSQGNIITNACINNVPSSLLDVLVSADGTYKITGLGFGVDALSQVRRVNGQNGFMLWSATTVDSDKNIYSMGYSQLSRQYELRKWTAVSNSLQDGILIDSSESFWGISDFFVDSKGSVYTVGPNYISVRKWTDGQVIYLTRNPILNRPMTLLIDSEENIYIGELNQITVWPAKSNESLPVITVNQTNGLMVDNNYKNIIQMDRNGSLYLLSTDRAVFGTKILKYQCNNCTACVKNYPFTAVSYQGAYGPLYKGNMKLSDYGKWSELIKSGQATEDDKAIISGMAVTEGNLDSIQAYDGPILTAGAMQKTIIDSGGGEFEVQVYEFKQEHPQIYERQFERCGWKVSAKKQLSFQGKAGSVLKQYLRKGFKQGSIIVSKALGPIACAISTPEFQLKQVQDFIVRLQKVLRTVPTGYTYRIADYFKSYLGRATALDQHVNKPARVAGNVGTALNTFYKNNKNAPKDPSGWTVQQRSAYEREILQDYGVNREMYDPANRYEKLKKQFPLP